LFGINDLQSGEMLLFGPETPVGQLLCNYCATQKMQRSATVSFGLGQAIRSTSPSSMANPRDALSELSVLGVEGGRLPVVATMLTLNKRSCMLKVCSGDIMAVRIELPEDIEQHLETKWGNLPRHALEALAMEGYRARVLSRSQVRRMLEFETGAEVDEFMKRAGVPFDYTLNDFEHDGETSRYLRAARSKELQGR
jgi:hypothetical protein